MKESLFSLVTIRILLSTYVDIVSSQLLCSPPDAPAEGIYSPKLSQFEPGQKVTYECSEGSILVGQETSRCNFDGNWSNPTPFCDVKTPLKSIHAFDVFGNPYEKSSFTDGNALTCFRVNEDPVKVFLDRPGSVYAVRLFLRGEPTNIDVISGGKTACSYKISSDESQYLFSKWVLILCSNNYVIGNTVMIKAQSSRNNGVPICEIEIFMKEDDDCDNPPDKRISNGYFKVNRSVAKLICEQGYHTEGNHDRLICHENTWLGGRVHCYETVCSPILTATLAPGGVWDFPDHVRKITPGTMRKLICEDGYKINGGPETIVCQEDGLWSPTKATCVEILCNPVFSASLEPGNEWKLLDSSENFSVGTRRKLFCEDGYEIAGSPETIVCQNDGFWSATNATCVEISKSTASTKNIILGIVEVAIIVMIISLQAAALYSS